jgi:hypothetical protein
MFASLSRQLRTAYAGVLGIGAVLHKPSQRARQIAARARSDDPEECGRPDVVLRSVIG